MTKETYSDSTIDQKLVYVNNLLKDGISMRSISTDLGLHKNTIPSLLKKNNYILDHDTNQYIINHEIAITVDEPVKKEEVNPNYKATLDKSLNNRFSIPTKIKVINQTKAFNIVVKLDLVEKLDQLATSKGYSRNELINYMLNYCIDNI